MLAFTAILGVSAGASAQDAGSPDQLAERIRAEIIAGDERSERSLAALRELRDPALKPLFGQLAAGATPIMRRNGALGRAELESPSKLDPFLIAKIPTPEEQLVVLEAALRQELLDVAAAKDLLGRTGLHPAVDVYLRLFLAGAGDPAPPAPATTAGADALSQLTIARGELLGMQTSDTTEMPPTLAATLADSTGAARARLLTLLDDVARLRLEKATSLAIAAQRAKSDDALVSAAAVQALLANASDRAARAWLDAFESPEAGLADRLRLALLGLAAPGSPATIADRLATAEEPLIRSLGIAAVGLREGRIDGAMELIELRYALGVAWLLDAVEGVDDAIAIPLLEAVIAATSAEESASNWEFREEGVRAAEELAERAPDRFLALISEASSEGDIRTQHTMLLGAIRPGGGAVGARLGEVALSDAESSALAAIARGRATTGEPARDLLDALRSVAAGRGALHPARRVQAAWLALRLAGDDRAALARILAPSPS